MSLHLLLTRAFFVIWGKFMPSEPRVSVLTAFYKEDPILLEKCIKSVLSEPYMNLEFILINDDPESPEKIEQIIPRNDSRIKYLRNEMNLGLTKSLNKGLAIATGKYIMRLDSNDMNVNQRIFNQVNFLEENNEYGFCGSRYLELLNGEMIEPRVPFCPSDAEIREKFGQFNPFAHSTLMFRRELLDWVRGYSESFYYSQDYDLTYRLLKKTKAANLSQVLVYRHISELDISRKRFKKQLCYAVLVRLKNLFSPLCFKPQNILFIIRSVIVLISPQGIVNFYKKVKYGYV